MLELPPKLRVLRHKQQTIEFSCGTGEVIKVDRHTKTRVKGGGTGASISTYEGMLSIGFQSLELDSEFVDMLDVWVKSDDGRECNLHLFKPNIGAREGHRVLYVTGRSERTKPPITILFVNQTTESAYTMYAGGMEFRLRGNKFGLFWNPKKRQAEFEELVHEHVVKISSYVGEHIPENLNIR